MPPKLRPLPSKRPPPAAPDPEDDEITIGNIKVGSSGVEFTGEGNLHVPCPELRFESLRRVRDLGQGVQGNVSKYISQEDNAVYAVKKITIPSTMDKRNKQTVAGELRNIFSQKRNDYTVQLYNAYYRNGALRLVMEYMDWGNLEELVKQQPHVPETACAYITAQILHALEMLHTKSSLVTESTQKDKRQIHRDIKPANVLLSCSGQVKLADFGIATSAETMGVNSFVGTATYMSPERIQGQMYSTPSDIWSVGVVVAEILSGKYPFPSVEKGFMALLREITAVERIPLREKHGCSIDAEDFVNHCLGQDPAKRSTAHDLLNHPWIVTRVEDGKRDLIELLHALGDTNMHRTTTLNSVADLASSSSERVGNNSFSSHSQSPMPKGSETILPSASQQFKRQFQQMSATSSHSGLQTTPSGLAGSSGNDSWGTGVLRSDASAFIGSPLGISTPEEGACGSSKSDKETPLTDPKNDVDS